jgi:hypothetical protein
MKNKIKSLAKHIFLDIHVHVAEMGLAVHCTEYIVDKFYG